MKFDILTLLPGFFDSALNLGVIGRAVKEGTLSVKTHDIREFTTDTHKTVDDAPYGGGAGMLMKPAPVAAALRSVLKEAESGKGSEEGLLNGACAPVVILLTPQGVPLTQKIVRGLAEKERLILLCGRYEGVDERIRPMVDMEISIGDYILTGGEAAALILLDSVGRLIPGVLGCSLSSERDSFSDGLLEGPQYTRPELFEESKVPDVLLSGDHAKISRWRRKESLRRTMERRPELLKGLKPDKEDRAILDELRAEGGFDDFVK